MGSKKNKKQKTGPKKKSTLLYRNSEGREFEIAEGSLSFRIPVRETKSKKRPNPFIEDEASEASEASSEIEIPEEDLDSDDKMPEMEPI